MSGSTSPRPNILWLCSDQQRFDSLGCYGNPHVRTPNIDRLASSGLLFENAFCQNPLCQPSRGSFLTGRYPTTNRLTRNGQVCPPDLCIFPRVLKEYGYVNGLIGKLHLNACDNRLQLGSEWWREPQEKFFAGGEPRIDDGYDVFLWDHAPSGRYTASNYTQWLQANAPQWRLAPGARKDCKWVNEGRPEEYHQSTWCANEAINFIELNSDRPQPWLLSVNFFDPHPHFDPPEEWLKPYLDHLEDLPPINYVEGEYENKPPHHREVFEKGPHSKMSTRDHQMVRAAYYAMCNLLDKQVGRILKALEDSGQLENTIVIYMSDHGELLGDHGLWPKGPFLYDCSVQVPLMLSWPGKIPGGRRASGLVELTDIVPTLRDAMLLPPDRGQQGRSLWDECTGKAPLETIRDDVYCEYPNSNPHDPGIQLRMVRTDEFKLIHCASARDGELYDLRKDPGENYNQWNNPDYREAKCAMLERLARRQAYTTDEQFPRIGVF